MGSRRIKAIRENAEAELICVSDKVESVGKTVANEAQCEYVADYRDIVERDDVDCVIVSLPNKFHLETSVAALKKGKHVLCEKPLARTPDEARQMVKIANGSKAYLKVGSNLRYFPNVMKAKELVEHESIGELLFLRGWIGHFGSSKLGTWFLDQELAGGGTFLDNGCHMLDLTRWFLGEVSECTGLITTAHLPISPLEDIGLGIFRTQNGKLAFIQSSWVEWADYMYMEIYGTQGFLRIDNRNPVCQLTLGSKVGAREIFDYALLPLQSYKIELEDFVKTIRQGKEPSPNGFDGLRVVEMVYGIYESSRSGRKVTLGIQDPERSLGQAK